MDFFATLCNGSLLPDFAATAAGISDNLYWFVNTYPMASLYVALGVLLLVLLLLVRSRRARRDVRVYQNDGGFAVVSQKALRHLIYIACDDAGLASNPKICFREVKGRIHVQIGLKLFQSQRLNDVHELLRQRIRSAVEETHGIQVGDVSVKVLGFRKDPYRQEAHDEDAQDDTAAVRPAPGEASAASLYEEPITGETVTDDESDHAAATEEGPKKRRFGFFGRRKEPVADGLFVSDEADSAEIASEGESTETEVSGTEAADPSPQADDKSLR